MALTKIIDNIQKKRPDKLQGEIVCYSGLALPKLQIEDWRKEENLYIQGYRSASLSYQTAMYFAELGETDVDLKNIII